MASADSASRWLEFAPVSLDEFVQSREFLRNPLLSPLQYEAVRYAERVYLPPHYAEIARWTRGSSAPSLEVRRYWGQDVRMVNFLDLEWGKGGGKDHTCRIISLRVAYLLLCMVSPQDYFGFAPQDEIHLLNVASSSTQANLAFFGPMRKAVTRAGNWMSKYAEPLQGMIRYTRGNLQQISGHSDAETQEGLNLLLGICDELDAFKREEELEAHRPGAARESPKSAESILKMMRTSMRTRFPETGKNVRISYPRYQGSMIQTLVEQGKADNARYGPRSRYYVSGPHPTWVVNPLRRRSDFDEDYRDDPNLAKARYECDPAPAVHPYFTNTVAIEACTVDREQDPLAVEYVPETLHVIKDMQTMEREPVRSWATRYDFGASLAPMRGAQYAMHADLAVKQDRAGIAMAHVRKWEDEEVIGTDAAGGDVRMTESRPFVVVDFAIAYEADAGADPPREIQIRWARELCLELRRRGFNVRLFTFDQFQSTESMQILERQGIEVARRSVDTNIEPYRGLRDLYNQGRVEQARNQLLFTELTRLNRLPNGKLDHPPGGSKDVADAVACAVRGAVELGGQEDGGLAYAAEATFARENYLEDQLPIAFVPPDAVYPTGFAYDSVMRIPIDFAGREAGFGGWSADMRDDDIGPAYTELLSGPARPDQPD